LLAVLQVVPFCICAALIGGGLAVAIVGFLDDRYQLSAGIRLAVHCGAALWALGWLGGLPPVRIGDNYGPGVRANFLRLVRWVEGQWPLPLATIENCRSLVSVWNLCNLLVNLLENPVARGTWMVSDCEDLSTPELIRRIGRAMDRRVTLVSAPVSFLRIVGILTGRTGEVARLCGSLVVDATATREKLEWLPPLSVDESLARTVSWYLSAGRRHGA
jgi:nucleoside-diphosphate-sugar epimerase